MTQRSTYDRALDLLAFRARSEAELRRKLIQKGEPAEQVDAVIGRLREQKLLDDADFALQFARSKATATGSSKRRILTELARKGVAREVADSAVNELAETEGVDLSASVHRVAEKKWRTLAKLDDRTARQRLYAFLARRGYDPEEIREAMCALKAGAGADVSADVEASSQ
jgi:regulatory protein